MPNLNYNLTTTRTTTQTTQTTQTLSDTENEILLLIEDNPKITQREIAEKMDISINTIKYYINSLKKKNVLYREGTSHNGSWIINRK